VKRLKLLLFFIFSCVLAQGQTLIINEFSNGPSGAKEYVELLVIDNTIVYDCNNPTPPCIDIRGWIFDDHSGYHSSGTSGVGIAPGCVRFNNDALWSCVPVGTLIVLYNGGDRNASIPADDYSTVDGNFTIIADLENLTYFEFTETTPGAAICNYPATGWGADPSPTWSNVGMSNSSDCARIVDLGGCEVFSVCYGNCNLNNLIYFAGGGGGSVYMFNDVDPNNQSNWTAGTTSGPDEQTPGEPNNAANEDYIAQFNNGGNPITPTAATANVNTPISCGCTNSATASASGSIPGYTYEWYDANYITIGQSTITATNLCGGTYNVIATSSVGCPDTAQVVIAGGGTVSAGGDVSVDLCSDMPALNLIDEVSGTPNLGGAWSGPTALANGDQGTYDPSVNTDGIYKYVVLGSGGCPNDTAFVTIEMGLAPNAGAGTTLNLCSSAPALNLFDELTGTPQNTGVWQGPSVLSNGNLGTFDPAVNTSGTYPYIILGSGSCINDTAFVIVNTGSNADAGTNGTLNICDNLLAVDLFDELGGSPDLGGTWSPALTSGTGVFDPAVDVSGQYTYTVSATSPCVDATAIVDVTVFNAPSVIEDITHVTCNGANDAEVDLTITPGVGNTVVWTLPTANTVTQEDIGPVSDGDYDYEITTADGCIVGNSITLNQPLPIDLVLNITPQTCPGSCDGEIVATSTNGTGAVTYSMNGGAPTAGTFTNLCDGNLTITVTDANSCQVATNTTMTATNPAAEPTIDPMTNICLNGGNFNFTTNIPGGTWTGFGITNAQTGEFDPVQAGIGTYNIIYTIPGQCGGDDTLSVNVVAEPQGDIQLSEVLGCAPLGVTFTNLLADANNVTCQWDLGNGTVQNSCVPLNYTYMNEGCYDISLMVTDVNGCEATFNAGQQVCVMGQPDADFTLNNTTFEEGSTELIGEAIDPVLPIYNWTFENNAIGDQNTVLFETEGIGAGFYEICLATENDAGCVNQTCQTIEYKESFTMYIPNTFSPNGDGINDLFYPVFFSGIPEEFEMYIFDRWGQIVLHSKELNVLWDGSYKGALAPDDTYIWKVNYKLFNDTGILTKTGHVNLLR
jgi:gliding motility-associated-like protein